ncbi:hypothetical protein VK792_09325 [Mesobacterium sp. TK19101]|uniref:Uncharacterized protein n=1 Tax=Mesobacterium hydrothermale TaxID=3111907 RepID=A0ABU6HG94_9RHOB|nr:hypothetical protein [Mesobacterium sp. TK19101]MEC3861483.1 hypothetical protein [Mesobacterium sp. TK19101]
MKNLILTSALALATLTGVAYATTSDVNVTSGDLAIIQHYAPGDDVTGLSPQDMETLLSYIHSGRTESEKFDFVRGWLEHS